MEAEPHAGRTDAVQVVTCDPGWATRWDSYVEAAPGASLYHLWRWRDVNRDEFGHATFALAALEGDRSPPRGGRGAHPR